MMVLLGRSRSATLLCLATAIFCIAAAAAPGQCLLAQEGQPGDAGILYEVWHTFAAQAMQEIARQGGKQLTTELVIQSWGNYSLDDVYGPYNVSSDIYNVQPQLGFYCLYRKRPNDTHPPIPDCPNISKTAEAHAKLLIDAHVDYVAVDVTNWPNMSTVTDAQVIRPTEVLFEEWKALRSQGIPTPQIAPWVCSPANSNTWQYVLDNIYNTGLYDDLIYHQNGKKVFFVPYRPSLCQDDATSAAIESNGGRNDIVVVNMWALFGQSTYSDGVWGFFSPCTTATGTFTTSMVGAGDCNQFITTNSSGGVVEVSASGAYMVSESALPFASPGHMRGLTMQRLFKRVLEQKPPHVFVSSFNEHIGGRQGPSSPADIAFNMGLPFDSQRKEVWVDTYASEFSRDIEPTVEGGDIVYKTFQSCMSLFKQGLTCSDSPASQCCSTSDKEIWANVWSLQRKDGSDNLLTQLASEKAALLGEGWQEACNAIPGPSVFCVDQSIKDGRNGPFMLYNTSLSGTAPLFRCITTSGHHFVSNKENCEALGKMENVIGFMSQRPGGETLRALRRCIASQSGSLTGDTGHGSSATIYSHALDLPCKQPSSGILGFVR